MGKQVVRMGDMTAHGGVVIQGCPTVLAGGKPVARVGDMHTCPMFDGLKPHVGGPIGPPGGVKVLVGGMPIAVVGGIVVCIGPPDTLNQGLATVLAG